MITSGQNGSCQRYIDMRALLRDAKHDRALAPQISMNGLNWVVISSTMSTLAIGYLCSYILMIV